MFKSLFDDVWIQPEFELSLNWIVLDEKALETYLNKDCLYSKNAVNDLKEASDTSKIYVTITVIFGLSKDNGEEKKTFWRKDNVLVRDKDFPRSVRWCGDVWNENDADVNYHIVKMYQHGITTSLQRLHNVFTTFVIQFLMEL